MGAFRSFVLRLLPQAHSYTPPPPTQEEEEAQRVHRQQMVRLREAIDSRKRIDDSVDAIQDQLRQLEGGQA